MIAGKTFVLVPGGWHGGWCYRAVADRLRSQGHRVFCLTLTGLGERAHLAHPGINLDTHIADVIGVLEAEELSDVILLGHSYAGCVIRGVADRKPDLIGTLVYLDAIVPEDGECMFDHVSAEFLANVTAGAKEHGRGYLVPIPPMDFLAVAPAHAAWVTRRLSPHPIATASQKLRLGSLDPAIKRIYIDCDSPCIPPTELTKSRLKGAAGWTYHTMHTGHDPFIDHPDELSELLIRLAT